MFIAALLVGLLVAYYFGTRPGMFAAGAACALFLLAVVLPAAATYAYVLVCAAVAGVIWLGPKFKRPDALASGAGSLGGTALKMIGKVRRVVKQAVGQDDRGQKRRRGV